jgi:hypothetical protein
MESEGYYMTVLITIVKRINVCKTLLYSCKHKVYEFLFITATTVVNLKTFNSNIPN